MLITGMCSAGNMADLRRLCKLSTSYELWQENPSRSGHQHAERISLAVQAVATAIGWPPIG